MTFTEWRIESGETDVNLLECALCGLKSSNITKHVKIVHQMTAEQYTTQFGQKTQAISESTRQKNKERTSKIITKNKLNIIEGKRRKDETLALGVETLKCRLCDYTSPLSLISHITRKHGVQMSDYRAKYPDDIIQRMSPTQKKITKDAIKEAVWRPEVREKMLANRSFPSEIKHWLRKGFSEEEAKQKVSEFQREQSLKGNNEVTRALLSEKNSGDNNPMSIKSISRRLGVKWCEARKLTPCYGRVGLKHPFFGKKHTEESLQKIASAPHLSNPSYRSKGEQELLDECLKHNPECRCNAQIGRWNVDVIDDERKLIIEFFGDYWHMNPKIYDLNKIHNLMNKNASYIWQRDARKIKELTDMGYKVLVIWENDWRLDRDECLERINDAFN